MKSWLIRLILGAGRGKIRCPCCGKWMGKANNRVLSDAEYVRLRDKYFTKTFLDVGEPFVTKLTAPQGVLETPREPPAQVPADDMTTTQLHIPADMASGYSETSEPGGYAEEMKLWRLVKLGHLVLPDGKSLAECLEIGRRTGTFPGIPGRPIELKRESTPGEVVVDALMEFGCGHSNSIGEPEKPKEGQDVKPS